MTFLRPFVPPIVPQLQSVFFPEFGRTTLLSAKYTFGFFRFELPTLPHSVVYAINFNYKSEQFPKIGFHIIEHAHDFPLPISAIFSSWARA
jgi:hypothetical protein